MIPSIRNAWVIRTRPVQEPRIRICCFPFAGGSASTFRTWLALGVLPEGVEVCALELPGHGERLGEPALTRFSDVVQGATASLLPFVNTTPFVIFGHSLGALLGFEVARTLQREYSSTPHHLFVSACSAPQVPHTLASMTTIAEIMEYLRSLGSHPIESMIARRFPLFQADFALRNSYEYKEGEMILSCPITAFGGEQDTSVPVPALADWKVQTSNDFAQHLFPGSHFFFQEKENQRHLVQLLSSSLLMSDM